MKALGKNQLIAMLFLAWMGTASAQDIENVIDPIEPEESTSQAASPLWLSGDVSVGTLNAGGQTSFLGSSEIGGRNWSISAKLLQSSQDEVFGLPQDSSYFNFDVKRRLLGSNDKSNLKLGLGWQEVDIDSQLDASGPRVSLSGQYKLFNSFKIYGATSYFPELEDEILNTDLTAYEIEAGLLYKPLPSVSLKAGYRVFELDDLDNSTVEDLGSSSGFLLGTDLSW